VPQRPKTICHQIGCGLYVEGDYCAAHKIENAKTAYDRQRADDPTRKMYQSARWRKFRLAMLTRNPMCQRLERGEACRSAATVIHHLTSPESKPALFLVPSNVVCVCALHHPAGVKGTPEWKVGIDFSATIVPKYHA
jgi:hypothetical protein